MRCFLVFALVAAACSDPGPRDRSLLIKATTIPLHPEVFREKRPVRPTAQPSVIGLAADPLATLYAEGAPLIVRCADVAALERTWKPHTATLRRLLPELGLPELPPATLLRVRFGLPDEVTVDRMRPFAFVRTPAGWAALIPVKGSLTKSDRLRMLDAHYCVAGSTAVVAGYKPGFRSGFHLPGDVSVLARGEELSRIGTAVRDAAAITGIQLPALPALGEAAMRQIQRIDLALRFSGLNARIDVRFAPDRGVDHGLADHLSALQPRSGTALQWLPTGATFEIETGSDLVSWLDMARLLGALDEKSPLVREALAPLGDDAAFQLHLRDKRPGVAMLVAELAAPDREAAQKYVGGESLRKLMKRVAGSGGHLEYTPNVFVRNGVKVGTITGYFSGEALEGLRARGAMQATMADFLRGPVVIYVGLSGSRLWLVAGERSRDDRAALLDRIGGGTPRRERKRGTELLHSRLFTARVDVTALLRGTKNSARHWHAKGDRLRALEFEEELMLEVATSVEGGALRVAAQVPDAHLAAIAARIRDALAAE